jgi:hypothetical protein
MVTMAPPFFISAAERRTRSVKEKHEMASGGNLLGKRRHRDPRLDSHRQVPCREIDEPVKSCQGQPDPFLAGRQAIVLAGTSTQRVDRQLLLETVGDLLGQRVLIGWRDSLGQWQRGGFGAHVISIRRSYEVEWS